MKATNIKLFGGRRAVLREPTFSRRRCWSEIATNTETSRKLADLEVK